MMSRYATHSVPVGYAYGSLMYDMIINVQGTINVCDKFDMT